MTIVNATLRSAHHAGCPPVREGGSLATIDDKGLAGHEPGEVGDEEDERARDLFGRPEPAQPSRPISL